MKIWSGYLLVYKTIKFARVKSVTSNKMFLSKITFHLAVDEMLNMEAAYNIV